MRALPLPSTLLFGCALSLQLVACDSDATPKAWNALATCIVGKDAASPIATRVQKLRLIQLGNAGADPAAKDAWPARCNAFADDLFATLPTSGETAVLRGKLREKLNCNETKGSCKLPSDTTLLSATTDLWDAAKAGHLTTEVAASVAAPATAPDPQLDSKTWKPLSSTPAKISGPVFTPDGRGVVVMKAQEGRSRPSACEFSDSFNKVRCIQGNANVPELPAHTIEVVSDAKGIVAAGLTDTGMVAYDLTSGDKSEVRGRSRGLLRDGLVVEKGAKDDLTQEPPPGLPGKPAKGAKGKAKAKAKPAVKEEGFVAVELSGGKAAKDVKLPITASVGDPIALGNQILFLNPVEGGAELVTKSFSRGRIGNGVTLKGGFAGGFHTCRSGSNFGVAVFGPRSTQNNAKATAGDGKTQLSVTLFQNNAWTKPVETTIPFERAYESDLLCGKAGASLVWAKNAEGGAQIGRVDCNADGCKTSDVKLPGVQSKWWWGAAPIGDKVFVLWRSTLGETRLRVAPLAELANTKDILVFDAPDFGGPTAGEVTTLLTDDAALFVFRNEQPAALRLGADGSLRVLSPS